jgi:MFS family permease
MGIGRFAFTPLLPLMLRDGVLDLSTAGGLASANYAGYLMGALLAARIPLAPARLGLWALLLTVLLTAAMALPGPAWWWFLLRFAAGVSSALAFVATSAWCLGALTQQGRPEWGGAAYAGVGSGIALAGLYCLQAGATSQRLWLELAVLALLLVVPVALVLRRLPAQQPIPPRTSRQKPMTGVAVRGLVLCYGLMGFGYILPATYLPVLGRSLVDDPRIFGLAWPVFGLTAALSAALAGWWMRRLSRLKIWALAQGLMGVGVLLPSLWLNPLTIALAALLVGGTFMVVTLVGVQEIRHRVPDAATTWVGRMTAAFAAGQILGPLLASLLVSTLATAADGLSFALQAGAASLLGSALWLGFQNPAAD